MPSQEEKNNGVKQLNVPAWMWTSDEWASIVRATNATQLPILKQALRELKSSNKLSTEVTIYNIPLLRLEIYRLLIFVNVEKTNGSYYSSENKVRANLGKGLKNRNNVLKAFKDNMSSENYDENGINELIKNLDDIETKHFSKQNYNGHIYDAYSIFSLEELQELIDKVNTVINALGKPNTILLTSEDDPVQFNINSLSGYIDKTADENNSLPYIQFMTMRINSLLNNKVISSVINNKSDESLLEWIEGFLSTNQNKGKLCIIDLSLLPLDVIHLLVAVIARLIFESLQRYRKHYDNELPTLLVMEEAHTFIKRYTDNADEFSSDKLSTKVFERIAREGRKFGLGMIVSSQRPSELSQTVLSQCNSYILHRIVNDKDQEMVKRLVPDNLGRLLDELPSLPQKKAIVLGAAVPIPTLVDINEIPIIQRPKSDDPKFWDVWTRKVPRDSNWNPIVDRWQKKNNQTEDKE